MQKKVVERDSLPQIIASLKAEGKTVGYTSGAFDILHPGHVQYLRDARQLCDVLVVGLNSDASIKSYKSPDRPINTQGDRALVLAGLESVDFIFLFAEKNNNKNIELLKPSIYIKAGDYTKDQLTSAPIVEKYGGRVEIVKVLPGYSSSAVISKIESAALTKYVTSTPQTIDHEPRPALFFDRDGTLIEHVEYLHEADKVKFIAGAIEGLKRAQEQGYRLIMITNQPGIGLGYFAKEDLFKVNRRIMTELSANGIFLDKIYFCPHSKSEGCRCRKPDTWFVERAKEELNIDLSRSAVVGDMTSDIEFGKRAGLKTVLVKTGRAGTDGLFSVVADIEIDSLSDWRPVRLEIELS